MRAEKSFCQFPCSLERTHHGRGKPEIINANHHVARRACLMGHGVPLTSIFMLDAVKYFRET